MKKKITKGEFLFYLLIIIIVFTITASFFLTKLLNISFLSATLLIVSFICLIDIAISEYKNIFNKKNYK